jgi:predicted MPP superfamily phosphohydrolase
MMIPFTCGTHHLGSPSLLNVSRGVGTWGPPMRLLANPEICLVTLEPAAQ